MVINWEAKTVVAFNEKPKSYKQIAHTYDIIPGILFFLIHIDNHLYK